MKTKIYLFAAIVSAIISMKAQIHPGNSLVVPEFGTGLSKTYVSNGAFQVIAKPYFTINLKTVPNSLATNAGPNTVAMYNNDLFVSLSQANQRIYKFPNYGPDPVQSIANVSQVTNLSSDYVGIAFDSMGNLYASEGPAYLNTNIYKYTIADNYATRINLGNGGVTSYFSNITFDAAGNLWASDYLNNRIVAIKTANLNTVGAQMHSFYTNSLSWAANGGVASNDDVNLKSKNFVRLFNLPGRVAFDNQGIYG